MRELGSKSDWTEPEDQEKIDLVNNCELENHVKQVIKLNSYYYQYACTTCEIMWEVDNVG